MAALMGDESRRSRLGWSDAMDDEPEQPSHACRLPKAARLALVGLTLAVFLLLVAVVLLTAQALTTNDYIEGRGEYRDREAARMEAQSQERIRRAMCDLLDQFPEGGWLDRPRLKYGCGPGIPREQLTPDEQQKLDGDDAPVTVPPLPEGVEVAPDGFQYGAFPNAPREPHYPTPGVAEPPPTVPYPPGFPPPDPVQPTAPPPLVDLNPITEPLCDALGVCA